MALVDRAAIIVLRDEPASDEVDHAFTFSVAFSSDCRTQPLISG
jgi:hypothetical protein